jgi:exosome complex component CSL4
MSKTKKSGQFVVPGEKLSVIEEFIPNSGTYVADGAIYSNNVGYVLMDLANKKVSVYPTAHNLNVPKVGITVVGNVMSVQSSTAVMRMNIVGGKFLSGFFSGIIHVSDVSFRYTENMFDAFKVGDFVRAKVISDKNKTYHLSTKEENLGVIYALCSQCGSFLSSKGRELECGACGNVEERKIASDYGTGTL